MRQVSGVFVLGFLVVMAVSASASANTFVWKDKVDGFTFSFPDTWTVQTDDAPTTRIRIAGPLAEDAATCRVKAEKDGRLKIYPKRLMTSGVTATLDRDFWEGEAGQYESAKVTDYYAPASLGGQGDATAAKVSFLQSNGTVKMNMAGEMVGSVYADTRYIVSCSSKAEEFAKYAPLFATIMSSVELDAKYHPFATGFYRDFLADPKPYVTRSKPGTADGDL